MSILKNHVLLLKSQKSDGDDKYETLLKEHGFTVRHIKTLDFVYINLEELKIKLNNPMNYSGIIFTSARSVQATKEALSGCDLEPKWSTKQNFVVGDTTHDTAQQELGLNCRGEKTGNAQNLATEIIATKIFPLKPFLYPCGNLKRDTLENCLKEHGIEVDAVTVYETVSNPNLKFEFDEVTSNGNHFPEFFVYFSPSGVEAVINVIHKEDLKSIKNIAIGPTTERAIETANLIVKAVAQKPTAKDVLGAILK